MNMKATFAAAFTAAAVFVAGAAGAVTIKFDTWLTGDNFGSTSMATLDATDNGAGGVDFVFTNTAPMTGDPFVFYLRLQYAGDVSGITLTPDAVDPGVAVDDFDLDVAGEFAGPWDIVIGWGSSNAGGGVARLEFGEYSKFTLNDASLASLFDLSGSDPFAMIHIGGYTECPTATTSCGKSTKYGGSVDGGGVTVIPVPAGLPLLASGIGVAAVALRRKRKAA